MGKTSLRDYARTIPRAIPRAVAAMDAPVLPPSNALAVVVLDAVVEGHPTVTVETEKVQAVLRELESARRTIARLERFEPPW